MYWGIIDRMSQARAATRVRQGEDQGHIYRGTSHSGRVKYTEQRFQCRDKGRVQTVEVVGK